MRNKYYYYYYLLFKLQVFTYKINSCFLFFLTFFCLLAFQILEEWNRNCRILFKTFFSDLKNFSHYLPCSAALEENCPYIPKLLYSVALPITYKVMFLKVHRCWWILFVVSILFVCPVCFIKIWCLVSVLIINFIPLLWLSSFVVFLFWCRPTLSTGACVCVSLCVCVCVCIWTEEPFRMRQGH